MNAQESWDRTLRELASETDWPRATATVDLLRDAQPRWGAAVVVRFTPDSLLFTRDGDRYPFPRAVHVVLHEDRAELRLEDDRRVVSGDFCSPANIQRVLDAFLLQLTGLPAPPDSS